MVKAKRGALVMADPSAPCVPAMTCANELSAVAGELLDLERIDPARPHSPQNGEVVFIAALSFKQLAQLYLAVESKLPTSSQFVGYVFDGYFSPQMHRAPSLARNLATYLPRLRKFAAIYTPFKELIASQASEFHLPLKYLPIGVDAVGFGGALPASRRFVSINGYGRQPENITGLLADRFNRDGAGLFSYTSHMNVGDLTDPPRHRDLFWNTLRHSRIALAYSPESCDPHRRFPCSFVGQRWYEALAAGCAIAGKRPQAAEAREQLHWLDATIELSEDPNDALDELVALAKDEERLTKIGKTNAVKALEEHDWRRRIFAMPEFASLLSSEVRAKCEAEIAHRIEVLKGGFVPEV